MRATHHRAIYNRFYALTALEFVFGIVYGTFSLSLPLLAESIFKNLALLGIIFALPELFGSLVDIPIGAFASRFGRKKTILYSGVFLVISSVVFMLSRNPIIFVATLIFYELATQSFIIPADAEQMALTPNQNAGKLNGLAEGLHNFGFSLGPVLAGLVLAYGITHAFWLSLFFSCVMIALSVVFLPRETSGGTLLKSAGDVWRRDHVFVTTIREFRLLGFRASFPVFIFFIFAFHWGFIALLEPLYTTALGLSNEAVGIIYAGFTLPIFFLSMLVGKFIDYRGTKGVLVSGVFLMALSTIGFSMTQNAKLLFILSLVSGVGDALLLPAVNTTLDRLSVYHTKERISGVKIFAESAGYFSGPLIAGLTTALYGFSNTFLYLGSGLMVLTIISLFVPLSFKTKQNYAKKTT